MAGEQLLGAGRALRSSPRVAVRGAVSFGIRPIPPRHKSRALRVAISRVARAGLSRGRSSHEARVGLAEANQHRVIQRQSKGEITREIEAMRFGDRPDLANLFHIQAAPQRKTLRPFFQRQYHCLGQAARNHPVMEPEKLAAPWHAIGDLCQSTGENQHVVSRCVRFANVGRNGHVYYDAPRLEH